MSNVDPFNWNPLSGETYVDYLDRTWNSSNSGASEQPATAPLAVQPGTPAAPPSGGQPTTPPAGVTQDQRDAKAIIDGLLGQYGLGSLSDWAWNEIVNGASASQVQLDLRQRPEYKARFPGIELREKNGLPPISAGDYVTWENTYSQLLHSYGIPRGVFDSRDYIGQQIGNNRGLTEIKADLDTVNQLVNQEPPEVLSEYQRLYGIGSGDLIAHYLDPKAAAPVLQKKALAAIASGTAARTGYGGLTQAQAEGLAGLGLSQDQLQQGFSQLQQQQQIFQTLPGEAGPGISRQEQLGAEFAGNAAAQQRVAQRVAARKAAFADGGQVATDRTGIIGAGTVPNA